MRVFSHTRRALNFLGFLICAGLFAYALFLQYYVGLLPCPLCIAQRVGVIILGILFLLAGIFSFRGGWARIWSVLLAIFALASAATSARHLWVQAHPDVPRSCASLELLWDNLAIWDFLKSVFTGTGDCAIVHWRLLGLSMPGWVLICFVLLGAYGVWVNWLRLR